jgi:hypothetical protein
MRHAGRGSDCALRAEVIFTAPMPPTNLLGE